MTFEEWWDVEVATKDKWVEDLCRSAWVDGYKEGYDDGWDGAETYADNLKFHRERVAQEDE